MLSAYQLITTAVSFDCAGTDKDVSLAPALTDVAVSDWLPPPVSYTHLTLPTNREV